MAVALTPRSGSQAALLPDGVIAHPAFDPLRPWLAKLDGRAGLDELSALASGSDTPPVTASGQRVRFCLPASTGARGYEQRVFDTGQVDTRPGNLHDLFNALAWIAFPRTKAAINARHVACLPSEGKARGPLRDLLTLVDEGGVIVACARESLAEFESLVRDFRWQDLFWVRRARLLADARCVLVGHSAFEKALAPYPGITCKALFLPASRQELDGPTTSLVAAMDVAAAAWVLALPADASPRRLPPLPVFGYPGWLPGSTGPDFYADRRWFRAAPAGRVADKLEQTA